MPRADCLAGVLDHEQVVLVREGQDTIHIRGMPRRMHRHDRAGARRDRGRRGVDIHVVGIPLDIHRDGGGADEGNGMRDAAEGVGRNDDFGPGSNAVGDPRQVHRGGSVRQICDGGAPAVMSREEAAELALESQALGLLIRSGADVMARLDDPARRLLHFFCDERLERHDSFGQRPLLLMIPPPSRGSGVVLPPVRRLPLAPGDVFSLQARVERVPQSVPEEVEPGTVRWAPVPRLAREKVENRMQVRASETS